MKNKFSRWLDFALYAVLAAMVFVFISRKSSGPDTGKAAASFDLPRVDAPAERFRLADQQGKAVLIEVFAGWCGVCERASPTMKAAWKKHGGDKVAFVGVSVDSSLEEALRIKREWSIPYDVVLDDGSLAKSYGIQVLPTLVLVGADGTVREVSTGAPSDAQLDRWLTEL